MFVSRVPSIKLFSDPSYFRNIQEVTDYQALKRNELDLFTKKLVVDSREFKVTKR
jgi:hypothetical protein